MIDNSTKDKLEHETPHFGNTLLGAVPSVVYNEDCVEGLKRFDDNYFDIAIVDPPYGLGNRLSDGGGKLKNTPMAVLYRDKDWDVLPTAEYWEQLFRVSKNQMVFGANYFLEYLPSSRGIICWDKKQDMPTLSAWELVWTSFDKPSKIYKKVSTDLDRFHPTQKPIGVYDFCLHFAKAQPQMKMLDTHVGSGSSRIAAHKMGLQYIGFEIDTDYYDKQEKRFKDFVSQLRMF